MRSPRHMDRTVLRLGLMVLAESAAVSLFLIANFHVSRRQTDIDWSNALELTTSEMKIHKASTNFLQVQFLESD